MIHTVLLLIKDDLMQRYTFISTPKKGQDNLKLGNKWGHLKAVLIWVSNIISMVAYHKCTIIALSGNEITPIIPSHLKYLIISCCWGCYEKIATRTWSWEQPKQPVDSCSYFNRVLSNSYLVKSLLIVKSTYI